MEGILKYTFELEISNTHEKFSFNEGQIYDIVYQCNDLNFKSGLSYVIYDKINGRAMAVDSKHIILIQEVNYGVCRKK